MSLYDVDVYAHFRVPISGVEADTPISAAEKARDQVIEALSDAEEANHAGLLLYFEQAPDQGVEPEGGDLSATEYFGTRARLNEQALEHAATLRGLIDGQDDDLGQMLKPIVDFLEGYWCNS